MFLGAGEGNNPENMPGWSPDGDNAGGAPPPGNNGGGNNFMTGPRGPMGPRAAGGGQMMGMMGHRPMIIPDGMMNTPPRGMMAPGANNQVRFTSLMFIAKRIEINAAYFINFLL